MLKLRPIVTYSFASVLVLWVLLGAIALPNANTWFSSSGFSIEEDYVPYDTLNKTNAPLNEVAQRYGHKSFKTNVFAIDNTPDVPAEGVQGLLYDRGESCYEQREPNLIPTPAFNVSKIALIQHSENCFLADKIIHAEMEGAVAVLVFNSNTTNYGMKGIMPKTVHIPAYYIDYYAGITLLKDLENLANQKTNGGQSTMLLRAVLLPSEKPALDQWQFALVIVAVMLITSILAITALQCHMWKTARQQQLQGENESLTLDEQRQLATDENFWRDIIAHPTASTQPSQPSTTPYRLEHALVDLLPTRVFKNTAEKKERCDSSEKMHRNFSVDSFGITYEHSSCVICLDQFEPDDILRRLPCYHEYHRDCIDVWLTKKSGTCPLCLQRIEIPTVPDEAHSRHQQHTDYYADMSDLAETWDSLTHDEEIALRQHPFAYNPTPPERCPSHHAYPPM